jgi:putative spermidine/putrescine transport system substrate-binding protein
MTSYRLSRRALLVAGTAALATPDIARAAAKSIVVANTGGAFEAAMDAALFKPFTAKTGIEVVKTVNVYAKLKAMGTWRSSTPPPRPLSRVRDC